MCAMGDIQRVGIVGSGIMGAGLAEVVAKAGFDVIVRSRSRAGAAAVVEQVTTSLERQVAKGRLEADARDRALARLESTDHLGRLGDCDLVIESVVEDLPTKRELFAELEQIVKPDGILATNTSTLPVIELAVATDRPDRVCGIHFFNPAPVMKLVEVVRPITASDDTIKAARAFATTCGKDAIEVVDRAGFVVNALLFPYLNNAVRMLEHGTASREDIDTADAGRVQLPDGPAGAARPRRPRHVTVDPRRAVRRVPGPELRSRPDVAADGGRRSPRPQDGSRVLSVLIGRRRRTPA